MAKNSKSTITEICTLPSSESNIYNGLIEKGQTFELRAMSTLEEKLRLSSSNGTKVLPKLIQACIVEPDTDIDVSKLKFFDLQYLMYKLRTVTYGPEYKIEVRCPYCGKLNEISVNLDDIPVSKVPADFEEPYLLPALPVCGDVIGVKLLSVEDYDTISKEAKRIKNKYPDYLGDPEFIVKWKTIIQTINGEVAEQHTIQPYIENMNAKDFRFLESKYDKISNEYGLNLDMLETCKSCGEDIEYTLPVTNEFFRPEY